MFKLEINTDNAAFEGTDWGPEIARILRAIAGDLESKGECPMHIYDINGNRVGRTEVWSV